MDSFDEIEVFLHVYFEMGKVSAYQKLILSVCGLETVHVSSHNGLNVDVGDHKVVGHLLYHFEQGQGPDPENPSNTSIVLDSSSFI